MEGELGKKLLVTLVDYTPIKGESLQESYFVILGYDPDGKAEDSEIVDGEGFLGGAATPEAKLTRWYYGQVTPIINIRKNTRHTFPGELVLHYGPLPTLTQFYFAAMDSDRGSRDAGKVLGDAFASGPDFAGDVATLLGAGMPTVSVVRQGFSILQKGISALLLSNKDDVRYSNIFSLRDTNDYLQGIHALSSDRAKANIRIVVDEDE